ncbi:DUF421 domain-containing protein [Paradesertivirga mongoliensis]|uniref:DUF421 domain-containing protein n=1 Tax=Paradesertivirga mongoliensis TaxID=2100740 RepID=A0ABW4ZN96_9SPHI|nr:DUF421 domain-containing protein [Pedobacter mongoliensis]
MDNIELESLLLGDEPVDFLLEVLLRSVIMFCFILIALRTSGKRGIKQLSIFELVIIIGLGSAAGDPMFYKDVGIVPALIVFIVVVGLYRTVTWASGKFLPFEQLIEGKPLYLIRNGKFSIEDFDKEDLSQDEFFAELRINHVEHLGQVRNAIIETSGSISLLFFDDKEVQPGLPLYPDLYHKKSIEIHKPGLHACAHCGNVEDISKPKTCTVCKHNEWVLAITTLRRT